MSQTSLASERGLLNGVASLPSSLEVGLRLRLPGLDVVVGEDVLVRKRPWASWSSLSDDVI